ncbi:MAG TPA: ABC transporter ATP-binding protein [Acidimicrobiales bacterium]|nr:ABC transporter ATP-binding protein [Acidimicrobiales bacterium]
MLQAHSGLTAFLRRPEVKRHLGFFLRPNLRLLLGVFGLVVVTTALPLAMPFLYRRVLELLVTRPDPMAEVLRWAGLVAAVGITNGGLNVVLARQSLRLGYGLIADLQAALYDKFQRMPLSFFARANTGALLNRITNEVNAAENLLSSNAVAVMRSVLTLLGAFIVLAFVNPRLLVIFVLAAPSAWLIRRETRAAQARAYNSFQLSSQLHIRAEQRLNVSGATVVKLYGNPEEELSAFVSVAGKLRDCLINIRFRLMNLDAVISTITAIAAAGALAGGGYLVTRGQLSLATLVLLLFYVGIVQQPMSVLATSRMDISRSLAAMERVFEVLEFEPGRRRPSLISDNDSIPRIARGIEFTQVSFEYPDASSVILPSLGNRAEPGEDGGFALVDIDFTAPRGSIVALVGATGSGKSTIASLAAGLYRPDRGHVLIDGVPVDSGPEVPRPSVAFVTQDAHLFHDTIRANIAFGLGEVSEKELVAACKAAQIHERIHDLPAGYNTIAGERGARLSGGERQRIAIARAILRRPSVVVLDEATAHLDNITEVALTTALTEIFADTARLVIAHRLSTVAAADEILVVDAGRIVERGRHRELLETSGAYARLHQAYLASA